VRLFRYCTLSVSFLLAALVTASCGGDAGESDPSSADASPEDAVDGTSSEEPAMMTTASGLRYEVLREGEGASPTRDQQVYVHYRGTFPDGTQFDSSYDRGEPAEFAVARVVPGFAEALMLMKPGGHLKAYIPSDLGYGDQGSTGGAIPPNQDLVFEIELLEIR